MEKHKIASAGFTLSVTSWENDGDNYNTQSQIYDTLEKATAFYKLMQLCKSKNNSGGKVFLGNTYGEFNAKQEDLIVDFFKNNQILLDNFDGDKDDSDDLVDYFRHITYNLLGGSEDYACRVMESCILTYTPEDIYVEKLNIQ